MVTRPTRRRSTRTTSALSNVQQSTTAEDNEESLLESQAMEEEEEEKDHFEKSSSQQRSLRAKKRKVTSKSKVIEVEGSLDTDEGTALMDENDDQKPASKTRRLGSKLKSPVPKRKPKVKKEDDSGDKNGGGDTDGEDEDFQLNEDENVEAEGDADQNDEEDGDDDSSFEEKAISRPRRKVATRRKKQKKTKSATAGRGPEEERTCPHCKKTIVTKAGLKYHLDNFVCRIDQCDNPELIARAKRKRRKSQNTLVGDRGSKRFRGPVEDRTCPDCKRVFTSTLGRNYHVQHKVCKATDAPQGKRADKRTDTGILEQGARFVTKFGIVEVVKDDRATPTNIPQNETPNKNRHYWDRKTRTESQNARIMELISANSRIRRAKVNNVYKTGDLSKAAVFNAYFGEYPRYSAHSQRPLTIQPMPSDPAFQDSFCPDRMVECILVPDRRIRNLSSGETLTHSVENAVKSKAPTRLFLKRRLLVESYKEELPIFQCMDCGQRFISSTGMKHHVLNKTCSSKKASSGEKRLDRTKAIDKMASTIAAGDTKLAAMIPKTRGQVDKKTKKRKKKKEQSMYPEVLMSLGFKVVKVDMTFDEDMPLPAFNDLINPGSAENYGATGTDSGDSDDDRGTADPKAVLDQIRNKLRDQQREYQRTAANQKHGSMYTGVFRSLGFKRSRDSVDERQTRARRRRRRTNKEVPPKPLPQIIDTRALIDEVESGRYPSFKKNDEDNHDDVCILCKEGGELICCDYCSNVEHMKCILSRFTVKEPEPDDDFLCHKCIGLILTKRNRAEKRRLQKLQREEQRQQQEALEDARRNPGIKPGMEYPYMAARGQELSELVEMLQDAQTRLNQSLAISKMNSVRRRAMGCFYNVKP